METECSLTVVELSICLCVRASGGGGLELAPLSVGYVSEVVEGNL